MPERPRILVNAVLHEDALRYLAEAGYEACIVPESDPEGSRRVIPECVGVVANASLPFDDALFATAPRVRVVGRVGVGYDNIDVEAATRRRIQVVNTPLPVIEPVAEHAILLMLACSRRLLPGDTAVRRGEWRSPENFPGPELKGKTLGLLGLGNTGLRVAEIAVLGLGMRGVYHDIRPRPDAERALGLERLAFDEVLARADVVSLHVSLGPSTRGLMSARAFALMKPGAIFVNLSRGSVVDEPALVEALRSGHLGGAGLDVYAVEPPGPGHPLYTMPNVVLTPHIGGGSTESRRGCSNVVLDITRVLAGQRPVHAVNGPF